MAILSAMDVSSNLLFRHRSSFADQLFNSKPGEELGNQLIEEGVSAVDTEDEMQDDLGQKLEHGAATKDDDIVPISTPEGVDVTAREEQGVDRSLDNSILNGAGASTGTRVKTGKGLGEDEMQEVAPDVEQESKQSLGSDHKDDTEKAAAVSVSEVESEPAAAEPSEPSKAVELDTRILPAPKIIDEKTSSQPSFRPTGTFDEEPNAGEEGKEANKKMAKELETIKTGVPEPENRPEPETILINTPEATRLEDMNSEEKVTSLGPETEGEEPEDDLMTPDMEESRVTQAVPTTKPVVEDTDLLDTTLDVEDEESSPTEPPGSRDDKTSVAEADIDLTDPNQKTRPGAVDDAQTETTTSRPSHIPSDMMMPVTEQELDKDKADTSDLDFTTTERDVTGMTLDALLILKTGFEVIAAEQQQTRTTAAVEPETENKQSTFDMDLTTREAIPITQEPDEEVILATEMPEKSQSKKGKSVEDSAQADPSFDTTLAAGKLASSAETTDLVTGPIVVVTEISSTVSESDPQDAIPDLESRDALSGNFGTERPTTDVDDQGKQDQVVKATIAATGPTDVDPSKDDDLETTETVLSTLELEDTTPASINTPDEDELSTSGVTQAGEGGGEAFESTLADGEKLLIVSTRGGQPVLKLVSLTPGKIEIAATVPVGDITEQTTQPTEVEDEVPATTLSTGDDMAPVTSTREGRELANFDTVGNEVGKTDEDGVKSDKSRVLSAGQPSEDPVLPGKEAIEELAEKIVQSAVTNDPHLITLVKILTTFASSAVTSPDDEASEPTTEPANVAEVTEPLGVAPVHPSNAIDVTGPKSAQDDENKEPTPFVITAGVSQPSPASTPRQVSPAIIFGLPAPEVPLEDLPDRVQELASKLGVSIPAVDLSMKPELLHQLLKQYQALKLLVSLKPDSQVFPETPSVVDLGL